MDFSPEILCKSKESRLEQKKSLLQEATLAYTILLDFEYSLVY